MIPREVVLAELNRGIRLAAGTRIDEPDRLHRTEAQRVDAARGHHLDRQAPFEELRLVELVQRRALGRDERLVEPRVLVPRERAVQVVPFAVVNAAGGPAPRRLLPHRDARNTFVRSMLSARTIGLIAS